MRTEYLTDTRRIVVKVGSALVVQDGQIRTDWLSALATDIQKFVEQDIEVVLVSSGAIAIGRRFLRPNAGKRLEEKQAAAAVGQPLLMAEISNAFAPHGRMVAQSLLTLENTENRRRWLNARATLNTLLKNGVVPVINENDSVATDEIRYGDNDRLAARVAQMIGADILVLLSDVDGLYTADPRVDASAQHIETIMDLDSSYDDMAKGPNAAAAVGSGGMTTKITAARIAWGAGCKTVITEGDREHPLMALRDGAKATWILPPVSPETARQTWLSGHLLPEGKIHIDAGAVSALKDGASLLAVGVTQVEGQFERGAAVAVVSDHGQTVGKGLTAYGSDDIRQIAGLRTDEMEEVLGYRGRPAIVHRDDLVLSDEFS